MPRSPLPIATNSSSVLAVPETVLPANLIPEGASSTGGVTITPLTQIRTDNEAIPLQWDGYHKLEASDRTQLQTWAYQGRTIVRVQLESRVRLGQLLIHAQKLLEKYPSFAEEGWIAWSTAEFGAPRSSLHNYIQAAKLVEEQGLEKFANMPLATTYVIAGAQVPEEAREFVVEANKTFAVSAPEARAIVQAYKQLQQDDTDGIHPTVRELLLESDNINATNPLLLKALTEIPGEQAQKQFAERVLESDQLYGTSSKSKDTKKPARRKEAENPDNYRKVTSGVAPWSNWTKGLKSESFDLTWVRLPSSEEVSVADIFTAAQKITKPDGVIVMDISPNDVYELLILENKADAVTVLLESSTRLLFVFAEEINIALKGYGSFSQALQALVNQAQTVSSKGPAIMHASPMGEPNTIAGCPMSKGIELRCHN